MLAHTLLFATPQRARDGSTGAGSAEHSAVWPQLLAASSALQLVDLVGGCLAIPVGKHTVDRLSYN